VSADLDKKGYKVVSISRSTANAQIERTKSILGTTISGVEYKSLDAGTASVDDLVSVMKDSVMRGNFAWFKGSKRWKRTG
jgi:hypothetical protein